MDVFLVLEDCVTKEGRNKQKSKSWDSIHSEHMTSDKHTSKSAVCLITLTIRFAIKHPL